MAEQVINPDLNFVKDIIASGGDTLKKCFQCATCSVVCNVTPADKPFPRKEMIHAQWGLKDKLFSNPDIWLCHQCSDCTAYCPRGAKPGEVLGAIRKLSIQHYALLGFLAKAVGSPKFLLFLFALPAAIFLIITAAIGSLWNVPRGANGAIVFSKLVPVTFIDSVFISTALFASIMFGFGILKYWKDMAKNTAQTSGGNIISAIIATVTGILLHSGLKKCDLTKTRRKSHLLVFYGFGGLFIATNLSLFYLYGLKWESPYPQTDILKFFGNGGAIALLVGITLMILNRLRNKEKAGLGSYFDWLFISVIAVIGVSGTLAQLMRLAGIAVLAYPIYFIHLVFVFFLFAYAPFSKMAHMFYRATAMVFAKYSGRGESA